METVVHHGDLPVGEFGYEVHRVKIPSCPMGVKNGTRQILTCRGLRLKSGTSQIFIENFKRLFAG